MRDALFFVTQVGGKTDWEKRSERNVDRVVALLEENKQLARSQISKKFKFPKKTTDEIQNTLLDRDLIEIIDIGTKGRKKELWKLIEEEKK